MKKRDLEKGITLIALVITIILLLLLAGVTLKIVLDNNFVYKTQKAVDKYSEAQKNETEQIKYFLENYLGEVDNTEGKEHRTLNGAEPAYNNPIIPIGFKTSSDGANWISIDGKTVSGWNDGLVIEDKDGNQFVWVPVDSVNVEYKKWLGGNSTGAIKDINQVQNDDTLNGINENDQITKYGGFYIGRYEAGIPESMTEAINTASKDARNVSGEEIVPVIKKNQVPWNYIDYNNSKANAESMYTGEKVKSGLLTGKMWDTTMQWLKNSGVNVETNCKEWGNYFNAPVTRITEYSPYGNNGANWTKVNLVTKPTDKADNNPEGSWLLKTGHTEYTKRKNIYDLAGNEWEWTNEIYLSNRVVRGGCYISNGTNNTAIYRSYGNLDSPQYYISFRIALYIY